MPNELVNIDVHFISLVENGANRRQIIWKSADAEPTWSRQVPILKTDDERHVVYGIVYAPDDVDTQGDYATAKEIEKAAYNFMAAARIYHVDTDHSFENVPAFVAESWLTKPPDSLFPDEPAGAWAVGIKIEDPNLWQAIKSGKYRALSFAGFCERINAKKKLAPEDESWDFRAADYTVEQLARACAWVKGVNNPHTGKLPEDLTKGDCKLPHHRPDGMVVLRGVMAAGAAIQGARGGVDISASDLSRVKRHLEAHYHEFDRQAPWEAEKAETMFEKFKKWWAGEAAIKEENNMDKEAVTKMVEEMLAPLVSRLEALEKQERVTKSDLDAAIKPVCNVLEELQKAGPGSKQDKDQIKQEDYYQLGSEIAKYAKGV